MFELPNAVQLRISIDDIEPVVWRRLVVPAAFDLGQLHLAIQAAFNCWNTHLHEFEIGGLRYGDATLTEDGSVDGDPRVYDEQDVRLLDFRRSGVRFSYTYDFGDDWHHTVEIEDMVFLADVPRQACCIEGAGTKPPEDVGGVPGYEQFLEVIGDPSHPEHRETKRWCGGHFDPDWFDLAIVDKDVRATLRANVRRRLHQPRPKATNG